MPRHSYRVEIDLNRDDGTVQFDLVVKENGERKHEHHMQFGADLLFERVHELLDNIALRPITNKLAAEVRAVRKQKQKDN